MPQNKTARQQMLCEPKLIKMMRRADIELGGCHNGCGSASRFARIASKEKLLSMNQDNSKDTSIDWNECK